MANKRVLKKQIRYACGDLAGECILAIHFIEGMDVEKMQDVVFEIASLQTATLQRVSFSYDKTKADFDSEHAYSVAKAKYFKQAYNTLRADFDEKVQEIVKSMNALLPQAQKDANKEALKQ